MEFNAKNTWELAELLESIAKQLKKSPNLIISKQTTQTKEIQKDEKEIQKEEKEIQNYEKLTVPKLKTECKRRGIRVPSKLRKAQIINLLRENDSGITTISKISKAFNSSKG